MADPEKEVLVTVAVDEITYMKPPLEAPPGERLAAIKGAENNSPVAAEPPLYENNADEAG